MDAILRAISYLMLILTVALTVVMLLTFRRPQRITMRAMLLAIGLSLLMLPIYLSLSGARLNPILAAPAMGLGLLVGFLWGYTTRLSGRRGQVIGRRSLLFLLGWGLSWALSQGLNLLGSALWASVGLLPLFFSTGTHVGSSANLLLRVLFFKPAPVPAQAAYSPRPLPQAVQRAKDGRPPNLPERRG